jgi:hypothetical protein
MPYILEKYRFETKDKKFDYINGTFKRKLGKKVRIHRMLTF